MNDAFLVRVSDGLADLNEQGQTVAGREVMQIAVVGDANAIDQFHHEERPSGLGGAGIEDPRNIWMIH